MFELHQNSDNDSFVKLFYANVTPTITINEINLTICASNLTDCQLSKVLDSVKDLIPNEWHKECNIAKEMKCKNKAELHDMAHAGIGFGVGVITVITLALIAFLIKKSRKRKQFFANSNSVNNQFIKNLK